jgi:hypothetical protein
MHMPQAPDATPGTGDMVILKRDLTPTHAHLLTHFLQHCGIQAEAGDTSLVQILSPLTLALGGAKIRVPQSQVQQALDLLAAFERGEFTLPDDENFDNQTTTS